MLDACLHREDLPEVVTMIGAILDKVNMKGLKTWETQRHDGMKARLTPFPDKQRLILGLAVGWRLNDGGHDDDKVADHPLGDRHPSKNTPNMGP